jgi:hypothetical protein
VGSFDHSHQLKSLVSTVGHVYIYSPMLAILLYTIYVTNYNPDPSTTIKFPSLPTLMAGMAPLTSCFELFTWADHGSHSAVSMSYVSSGRTIPSNSKDGAIPKIAPSSGQRCASRLGRVSQSFFKASSASHTWSLLSNRDIDAVTNSYSYRADSHVLHVPGSQVSQRLDSANGDQRIRAQRRTQTLPSVSRLEGVWPFC